ncbi:hypothetical protein [Parasphingorhabdus sp.]|uniref:hypothetical protein n=1 Tax=Parasphingorhabdus sp. TaxID=2709688 RepID=UPI002F921C9F
MKTKYTPGDLLIQALKLCDNNLDEAMNILKEASELRPDHGLSGVLLERVQKIRLLSFEMCRNDFADAISSLQSAEAIGYYNKITGGLVGKKF